MSRYDPIDRAAAERLLRGRPADNRPVAEVLAAAAGSPREGELAGEERAVAAFREAPRDTATAAPRFAGFRVLRPARFAAVAVGAAVMGVVVAVGAGVGSGTFPDPFGIAAGRESAAPPTINGSVGPTPPATPGTRPHVPAGQGASPAKPTASIIGLCRAYQAKERPERGKFLETPKYRALVRAAGGSDKVPAYCAAAVPAGGGAGDDDGKRGKGKGRENGGNGKRESGPEDGPPAGIGDPPIPPLPHQVGVSAR